MTSDEYGNIDPAPFQRIATVALQRKTSLLYANMEDQSLRSSLCVPFKDGPLRVLLVAAAGSDAYQRGSCTY